METDSVETWRLYSAEASVRQVMRTDFDLSAGIAQQILSSPWWRMLRYKPAVRIELGGHEERGPALGVTQGSSGRMILLFRLVQTYPHREEASHERWVCSSDITVARMIREIDRIDGRPIGSAIIRLVAAQMWTDELLSALDAEAGEDCPSEQATDKTLKREIEMFTESLGLGSTQIRRDTENIAEPVSREMKRRRTPVLSPEDRSQLVSPQCAAGADAYTRNVAFCFAGPSGRESRRCRMTFYHNRYTCYHRYDRPEIRAIAGGSSVSGGMRHE